MKNLLLLTFLFFLTSCAGDAETENQNHPSELETIEPDKSTNFEIQIDGKTYEADTVYSRYISYDSTLIGTVVDLSSHFNQETVVEIKYNLLEGIHNLCDLSDSNEKIGAVNYFEYNENSDQFYTTLSGEEGCEGTIELLNLSTTSWDLNFEAVLNDNSYDPTTIEKSKLLKTISGSLNGIKF